jgi:hypothetical protein
MNRREWIFQSVACLAAAVCDRGKASVMNIPSNPPLRDATKAFDHILLGTSDLESGIAWMEKNTGVRAIFGGAHPGRGTCNALLSFGRLQYLEIIAPDPAQANVHEEFGLAQLSSPRIVQWAVHTEDIAGVKRAAVAAGVKTIGPASGSRQRPDGKLLKWQILGIEQTTPLLPFFIQWEPGSPHPSLDAPRLGTVKSLRFETPQPDELRRVLRAAAIQADIRRSDTPRIVAGLETAKGAVEIS